MSRRRQCDYFNKPGGCRRGESCTFAHVTAAAGSSDSNNAGSSRRVCPHFSKPSGCRKGASCPDRHESPTGSARPRPSRPAPRNACRTYWETGVCRFEFGCKYAHESPTASSTLSPAPAPVPLPPAAVALARGTGTDFVNNPPGKFSPAEVQRHLRTFLTETYSFGGSAAKMYSFLGLLTSAKLNNKDWTSEDGQLLLNHVASDEGIGLRRLTDIFVYGEQEGTEVSVNAGSAIRKLSFQRGYVKLFIYYASDFVLKSTLDHRVNALYSVLHHNCAGILKTLEHCMKEVMRRNTFAEPAQSSIQATSGNTVFYSIILTMLEYLTRYKLAVTEKPEVVAFVPLLAGWTRDWMERVQREPPTFSDSVTTMPKDALGFLLRDLGDLLDKLQQIVTRETRRTEARPTAALVPRHALPSTGTVAFLRAHYIGPGTERPEGPRHDNDFVDYTKIRIAPTHEELVCVVPPFLPANIPGAPHPAPTDSMERILDIQFRLLREELTAPMREAVQAVLTDLQRGTRKKEKTQLQQILEKKGGRYRTDNVMFSVYTDATFVDITASRRGLSAGIRFAAPPAARVNNARTRAQFWEANAGKRLMPGALVALVWNSPAATTVHLGLVASSQRDIVESARNNKDNVTVRVAFFDSATDMRVLEELHGGGAGGRKLLLETPVMYESIRPFLEALCKEPAMMPFARYLVHSTDGRLPDITPPAYARRPGFTFDLTSLLKPPAEGQPAHAKVPLNVNDPASVQIVRERMREDSILDPSQSTALVDCLEREIAMVQGPPGTGKSYIGVQLLRVLINSRGCTPILLIAFTNHALDHLLEEVLDHKITDKVVRLGSAERASEKVAEFSMHKLEMVDDNSRLNFPARDARRKLKDVQSRIEELAGKIARREVTPTELDRHLSAAWPEHHMSLQSPPAWVQFLYEASLEETEGWRTAGKKDEPLPTDLFSFWLTGGDLAILAPPPKTRADVQLTTGTASQSRNPGNNSFAPLQVQFGEGEAESAEEDQREPDEASDEASDEGIEADWLHIPLQEGAGDDSKTGSRVPSPVEAAPVPVVQPKSDLELFFERFGLDVPQIPSTNRSLEQLQELDGDMWSLSDLERQRLATFWRHDARELFYETNIQQFDALRKQLADLQQRHDELDAESRVRLLQGKDIIGCTTTGAAKLAALLKSLAPKVVMVEEAGQVLEAHVLGSLVPSVQHLICIGDPMQLRPTLNNYSLSVDSHRGAELYKFDRSLMERLSQAGLPMSQLKVQRRMRPAIADLIRVPMLYPDLEDHPRVLGYPDVQGMPKNVFFMTHTHKEQGGGEESVSKHNIFEVQMAVDLVSYLVRQTPRYADAGSIVVLCAYLGQMVRLREAFANLFTVVIDERDQEKLANAGVEDREEDDAAADQPRAERVQISQRILLRTVDNFQGEEADIIILSLVRNAGELSDESRTSIGFLKSINRTNVALSRARHGLYILGNAANLAARSALWATVINKLKETDAIGPGLPIHCSRHLDDGPRYATKPGDIARLAPDGGCLFPCGERLGCGHKCPHKCHPGGHSAVVCSQRCTKLCARQHPCSKLCSEACGNCRFPIRGVELPCGHIANTVPCFQLDDLSQRICNVPVLKTLPHCEHTATMPCSTDPTQWQCQEPCGMIVQSCSHVCAARCCECQQHGRAAGQHKPHAGCGRHLFCGHPCVALCGSTDAHTCTTNCKYPCRQSCAHFSCRKPCGEPTCEPCKEPCTWTCPHYSCGVPCGSACNRLPCDRPCTKVLVCGHPCPSVCGEPCDAGAQVCPRCTTQEDDDVVDYILQRTLHEVDPACGTVDELLITLACRHVFTVETLDGHCRLAEYYEKDENARWTRPAMPPPGYKEPPTCPKCRAPVTSPRYGRVYKRANLDVLERNVAGLMSRRMHTLGDSVAALDMASLTEQVSTAILDIQRAGKKDVTLKGGAHRAMNRSVSDLIKRHGVDGTLLSADALGAGIRQYFPIDNNEKAKWMAIAGPLLRLYAVSRDVFETRFAHVSAHEAAFTALYRTELDACRRDPHKMPQHPEQYALIQARVHIGQPQPRADARFATEALWSGIEIRFAIAALARTWMLALSNEYSVRKAIWATFCRFVFQSCVADAKRALLRSTGAEAHRQILRSHLLVLRAKLELFQFDVMMKLRQPGSQGEKAREDLLHRARECKNEAKGCIVAATRAYRCTRQRTVDDEKWIAEMFTAPLRRVIDGWDVVEKSIQTGTTFYEPVSLADKMEVVKAMGFSHTGHWYSCPNGHAYVITECGGAMEASQCPECGVRIGGVGHVLDSTNRRADELERLGQQIGAQASPFAWGRV
ncbi:P-loop containing nucleoside triphosphate hydrolase protein [Auricularia subglabra TFB-10046 SS5]|nr:P-loop containing nucleoside triphosphate hydrolase protein [Auricularia subglabra TFB-10046 SS5]